MDDFAAVHGVFFRVVVGLLEGFGEDVAPVRDLADDDYFFDSG